MNLKKGFSFIDVIITLVIITAISLIVQQTAFVMMVNSKASISIEAERLNKSFVTEGKALCKLNQRDSPWVFSNNASLNPDFGGYKINGNIDTDIVITCETVSSKLKKVSVRITIPSLENKVITGEGFIN